MNLLNDLIDSPGTLANLINRELHLLFFTSERRAPSFLLRNPLREGGFRPERKEGRVAEWSKAADCKSVEGILRRFESCLSHLFVVDFIE